MAAMVDTMVLIHACHLESNQPKDKAHQKTREYRLAQTLPRCKASSALLKSLEVIYVSAVTITEFYRTSYDVELEWLDQLGKRLKPISLSRPIAKHAAKLLRERGGGDSKVCPKCMNAPNENACGTCGRSLTRYHRIADAMVAATADNTSYITELYCYDGGILALAPFLRNCKVSEPPPFEEPKQKSLFRDL